MMASIGGAGALERVIWGTGAVAFHPQPLLESFVRDFAFTDAVMERAGIAQITAEDKRNILFDNYARMSGLDLHARLARAGGDEFARSEEHTSELQSLTRISYAVFCLKKKIQQKTTT